MINWGLVGTGDIVRKRVAAALRDTPGSSLAAVSRNRAALAAEAARDLGAERWHARWQDLVTDPGIDAVYIATPVRFHAEQAIAAAEAGKHVLCEKPMAMDVAECDRIIAACAASGVTLGVAYYRHFYPIVHRIREILAAREIGTPVVAQIDAFERFNPQPHEERHWFVERAVSGGGPMFDFGCHRIELLLSFFGTVRHAAGLTANVVFDREVEDTAVAAMAFEAGPCATVTVTHAAIEPRDTVRIFGSEGSIHVSSLNGGDLTIIKDGTERRETYSAPANLHQPLIEDFVDALRTKRRPAVDGEVGRAVAAIEARIYQLPE